MISPADTITASNSAMTHGSAKKSLTHFLRRHCHLFCAQHHRPGQGARTDLTYHPDPAGHPVFLNAITLTAATLLRDLTTAHATTITRSTLPTHWTTQFPHHPTPSPRQIKKALNALHQLAPL